ncbi:MAG: hypothetical protein AB7U38_04630 [Hyphomicrobiales bacterium]
MSAFNYKSEAELFPARSQKFRSHSVKYRRFASAAEAVRFAIETLPQDLLCGAYLEADGRRFDREGIRRLYFSDRFPLPRKAAAPAS